MRGRLDVELEASEVCAGQAATLLRPVVCVQLQLRTEGQALAGKTAGGLDDPRKLAEVAATGQGARGVVLRAVRTGYWIDHFQKWSSRSPSQRLYSRPRSHGRQY